MIENQVLVWLGSAMAPLLPLLGALSNVLHFTTQKLLAMHCFVPPLKPYSASRTSTIAHGLMLGMRASKLAHWHEFVRTCRFGLHVALRELHPCL